MTKGKSKPPRSSWFKPSSREEKDKTALDYGPIDPQLKRSGTEEKKVADEPLETTKPFNPQLSWWQKLFGKAGKKEKESKPSSAYGPIAPHLRREGFTESEVKTPADEPVVSDHPRPSVWQILFGKPGKSMKKSATDFGSIDPELMRPGMKDKIPGGYKPPKRYKRSWLERLLFPRRRRRRSEHSSLFTRPIEPTEQHEKIKFDRFLLLTINSTVKYLLSYVIVYLLYQLTVIYTANRFDISGVLYYYDVFWPIGDSSPLWFPYFKIILITGSGPFFCLLAGFFIFRIFIPITRNQATKLFLLWISLHAMNMFFGAFVAGVTSFDGFGYVADWLFMNIAFRVIFSTLSLFLLAVFGYYTTRFFLETAPSPSFLSHERRGRFLLYQVLIPGILGALILIMLRLPKIPPYHTIVLFTLFAATISAFINRKTRPDRVKSFPRHGGRKFQWNYFLVAIVFFLLYRIVLSYGLHIIIEFRINVSFFGGMV
jgi:hypothetical protein